MTADDLYRQQWKACQFVHIWQQFFRQEVMEMTLPSSNTVRRIGKRFYECPRNPILFLHVALKWPKCYFFQAWHTWLVTWLTYATWITYIPWLTYVVWLTYLTLRVSHELNVAWQQGCCMRVTFMHRRFNKYDFNTLHESESHLHVFLETTACKHVIWSHIIHCMSAM